MKLAISNIAWEQHNDTRVLQILRDGGVQGIEIAPTKIWPDWSGATPEAAKEYRQFLENEGFEVPAMQAIVFGRPDLQVFQAETHAAFCGHMRLVADLAAAMETKVLVFGAPKNRKRGQIAMREAMKVAADLFQKIGDICDQRDCCIGWEHNPVEYACDFVTNVADAREFVDLVNHPGVQLHLDSGGMQMCGGNIVDVIHTAGPFCHYHISEPMLAPIDGGQVDHRSALEALKTIDYSHWVSIEMKTVEDVAASVQAAMSFLP